MGTLLVPAVLSLSGIGAYGWAKPVPVSRPTRLRSPRNHTVIVSLVGPLTNFILAALLGDCIFVLATASWPIPVFGQALRYYPPTLLGSARSSFIAGIANIVLGRVQFDPLSAARWRRPSSSGSSPPGVLPEYYRLQPALMFLPFLLILVFHNQWSELINHVISWWSGLLV